MSRQKFAAFILAATLFLASFKDLIQIVSQGTNFRPLCCEDSPVSVVFHSVPRFNTMKWNHSEWDKVRLLQNLRAKRAKSMLKVRSDDKERCNKKWQNNFFVSPASFDDEVSLSFSLPWFPPFGHEGRANKDLRILVRGRFAGLGHVIFSKLVRTKKKQSWIFSSWE